MRAVNPNSLNRPARKELKTLWVDSFGNPSFTIGEYQGFQVVTTGEPLKKLQKFLTSRLVRNRFILDFLRLEEDNLVFRLISDDQIMADKNFGYKNLIPFQKTSEDVHFLENSGFPVY